MVSEIYYEVHMKRALRTARISNVDSVMFVDELRTRPRSPSTVEFLGHRSAESVVLRFDSSWGLRIFSLSNARDKTKNIFLGS